MKLIQCNKNPLWFHNGKIVGTCPRCGAGIIFDTTKPWFAAVAHCESCDIYYHTGAMP